MSVVDDKSSDSLHGYHNTVDQNRQGQHIQFWGVNPKYFRCGFYFPSDYQKQLDTLKASVDIIIGTPGRVIDFYKQKAKSVNKFKKLK